MNFGISKLGILKSSFGTEIGGITGKEKLGREGKLGNLIFKLGNVGSFGNSGKDGSLKSNFGIEMGGITGKEKLGREGKLGNLIFKGGNVGSFGNSGKDGSFGNFGKEIGGITISSGSFILAISFSFVSFGLVYFAVTTNSGMDQGPPFLTLTAELKISNGVFVYIAVGKIGDPEGPAAVGCV